jgi:cysteine-rich repeat protein
VLDSLGAVVQTKPGQLGVATAPALGCALDVASGAGGLCIDGAPAMVVRTAANQAAMDALAVPGQIVLRIDEGAFYVRTPTAWRKMLLEAVCGDGSVDLPEECDDGANNADTPNTCRTTCLLPACGDGIVDSGEDCDDGNLNNGDGCSATCKKCGDGVCQEAEGESFANCPQDCPKPLGTASDNPGVSCKAVYDDGQTDNGTYWLQWGNMPSAIQVYCKQDTDFGTGTTGGWMLYCGNGKDSITGGNCANANPTWDKMKNVDYLTHASYSPQGDWWMSIELDQKVTSTPTACNARMRVKSDIGNWGKTDSGWMNNLQYSPPCGGSGGCWWGSQSGCNSGGIHLRANGNGYTSVDTMANGWVQITHGGGLGANGGYTGGKHTSFGAGGTASDPVQWEGYVR